MCVYYPTRLTWTNLFSYFTLSVCARVHVSLWVKRVYASTLELIWSDVISSQLADMEQ